jgi:TonB family protein
MRRHSLVCGPVYATIEIVVNGDTGQLIEAGVVRSSDDLRFDQGALEAVQLAFPVAPVPSEIVSRDGSVYLTWELYDDPWDGCSSSHAMPYLFTIPRLL